MDCDRLADLELVCAHDAQAGDIAAIHRRVFVRPWSEAEIRGLLSGPSTAGIAVLRDRQMTGFLIFRQFAAEAEILSLAVAPDERRQGAARAMMRWLTHHLAKRACDTVILEVDATNTAALALYRSLAFNQVGVRRDYYKHRDGQRGDAVVMRKCLKLDPAAEAGDDERPHDQVTRSA